MTSPATRAEVSTRLPEMTGRHIEAAMAPAAIIESGAFANERLDIAALVRSLSTGSHKRVSRVDLLALRDLLAEETRTYGSSTCRYACEIIDRWLSSDTQHKAGNSDFDAVEAEEAFQDYIAANRLNRTHEAER